MRQSGPDFPERLINGLLFSVREAISSEEAWTLSKLEAMLLDMTADKVLKEIQGAGGTVLKTSLDDTKENPLREALAKAAAAETPPPAASAG